MKSMGEAEEGLGGGTSAARASTVKKRVRGAKG